MNIMGRKFARTKEGRSDFKILTGKPKRKIPLGRPRHRWEDNVRMDFNEIRVNKRTELIRLPMRIIGGPCECGIESPGSIDNGVG